MKAKSRRDWGPLNPRTRVKPLSKKPLIRERREKDAIKRFISNEID